MRTYFPRSRIISFLVCCLIASIYSCKNKPRKEKLHTPLYEMVSKENLLIGTWTSSLFISSQAYDSKAKENIPKELSIEITSEATSTYRQGNKFNASGQMTIRVTNTTNNQEVPLRFYFKEAGTWKIYGSTLVETTEEGELTPMNDVTESVINQNPEIAASIKPIKGQSTSIRIISINETSANMEELEHHIKYTMFKKQ